MSAKRIATLKQVAEMYPAFTEASLRWLRFNGEENGFNRCVLTVGRRVLIDLDRFEVFLDESRDAA